MGRKYTVEEISIKTTANAIKEKLGKTDPIEWKDGIGFANAIRAISSAGGGAGLENSYDITFYDEHNEGLAFYSIKQGHSINAPTYRCKAWQTEDGINITFPYTPTENITIYANNNTYASEIYRYYGVDSGVYPYIAISQIWSTTGGADMHLWFGKRISTRSDGVVYFYESLHGVKYIRQMDIPLEDIVTTLQTYIDPTSLTEEDSSWIYNDGNYNNYVNFEPPFKYFRNVYRLDQ